MKVLTNKHNLLFSCWLVVCQHAVFIDMIVTHTDDDSVQCFHHRMKSAQSSRVTAVSVHTVLRVVLQYSVCLLRVGVGPWLERCSVWRRETEDGDGSYVLPPVNKYSLTDCSMTDYIYYLLCFYSLTIFKNVVAPVPQWIISVLIDWLSHLCWLLSVLFYLPSVILSYSILKNWLFPGCFLTERLYWSWSVLTWDEYRLLTPGPGAGNQSDPLALCWFTDCLTV